MADTSRRANASRNGRRSLAAPASTLKKARQNRSQLPAGANLCDYCTAKCCRYIALPLESPENWKDFDDIRWFLMHENVSVFVDLGVWYILMHRPCMYLLPDNRCGIYDRRPQICREYSTDQCEYDEDYTYEKIFETDEQVFEYAEALLGPRDFGGPSPSPPTLPLVNLT